jgi:hypothetical protein
MAYGKATYKNLVEVDHVINETTVIRMKLDENTNNGSLNMHFREFKTGGTYIGPTQNGLSYKIESSEQLSAFKDQFEDFVEKVRIELEK